MHELFPDAPLYTSVYNPQTAPWANVFDVRTSFLQSLPFAATNHEKLAPFMPAAFESFSFDEYDLVISITSEAAKGIITKSHTKHICYCLTPTRYLWSGYEEYFSNPALRIFTRLMISYLRRWDYMAAQRPDMIIAISKEVQRRIEKYYGRESEVVYPPTTISNVKYPISNVKWEEQGYFLVVSRLVGYKRVDIAIEACSELGLQLKIIGTGSDLPRLKAMAGPTVEFLGDLTDEKVVSYYKHCQALLFPGKEDFGLTVVEAQLFGKPVIAFKEGGALETIIEGKTGLFFSPQTKTALKGALERFGKQTFRSQDCERQARMFSLARFKKDFLRQVQLLS
jgi:glycosyltransferase involved in cell wall biosynthesis